LEKYPIRNGRRKSVNVYQKQQWPQGTALRNSTIQYIIFQEETFP